jgi:hypothetical protein
MKQKKTDQHAEISILNKAIFDLHGVKATWIESVAIKEVFGEKTVWSGIIEVFAIKDHPQATRCYAWSSPIEGSTKRRYFAVLHIPPVDSPEKAVRAAIVHDHKAGKLK